MNIEELIKILSKYPSDTKIFIIDDDTITEPHELILVEEGTYYVDYEIDKVIFFRFKSKK